MILPNVQQINYMIAHKQDDKRAGIIASNVICIVAAYVAVTARFVSRRLVKAQLQADDWWIVVGLVSRKTFEV